jgi:hypothetical protein
VPLELGGGFDVMKKIKRTLDPNNIMNPGKYLLDQAYEEGENDRLQALRSETSRGEAHQGRRDHALRSRVRSRPIAHDRAHTPAGHPGLGHPADRRQPVGTPGVDARPLSRQRLSGEELLEEIEAEEGKG